MAQEQNVLTSTNHGLEGQVFTVEQPTSAANPSASDASSHSVNVSEAAVNNSTGAALPESYVSTGQANTLTVGKISEPALLDERSLLACIVRTVPAGGQIRISSTVSVFTYKVLVHCSKHALLIYLFNIGWVDDIFYVSRQLPNRLGKMLAPLRWHDYKRKYGKLDDFVVGHPEVSSLEFQISYSYTSFG